MRAALQEATFQNQNHSLQFELHQEGPIFYHATVVIPHIIIDALYYQASLSTQQHAQTQGFHKGGIPVEYIATFFKENLTEHLKEFLFKYFVIHFLLDEIQNKKLVIAGDPRLTNVHVEPGHNAVFTFELSVFPPIQIQEWKYLPFKAPKRKNYKDLDRQVDSFIEEEKGFLKSISQESLSIGDWAGFSITLIDSLTNQPLFYPYKAELWLRLGDEEADSSFHDLFLDKKEKDSFITSHKSLQEYFSNHIDTQYTFLIHINNVVKNSYFCIEHFKRYFKLKTNKELYQKIIEVFSYRNDLSLRRSLAEESLKLLLSKHKFVVPNYIILRQQKIIIEKVKNNPDYHVYRMQKDFTDRIKQLAEKQMREILFLEYLAYSEELQASNDDIKGYLNLTNRQRMKDFLYFDMPITKTHGQEVPITHQELKRFYLREKALNHIIYHLMKK